MAPTGRTGNEKKTSTLEMHALIGKPDLTIMAEVCRKLELLNTAACRAHAMWAGEGSVFTTEDKAKFTNNVAGPIAVFKSLEEQLMDEGIFSSYTAQFRIRLILKEMLDMQLPSDEQIKIDGTILPMFFSLFPRIARRLLFANTTWMQQLYNQSGKNGEPYGRIEKANSFIQLISSDEGDSDDERIARQMLVKLDLQQIIIAAQWWLDILEDSEKLISELKAISDLKAKLFAYNGPTLSDLSPAERLAISNPNAVQ